MRLKYERGYKSESIRNVRSQAPITKGNKCIYCGTKVNYYDPPFVIWVRSRGFPVCSEKCRDKTDKYAVNDKKYKLALYSILGVCAVIFLICVFVKNQELMINITTLAAGVVLVFFPYPITSFQKFYTYSIRRTTLICRILGIALMAIGLILALI